MRLAALVDQLLAEARGGAPVDIERVAAEHPDLATELRELWAVAALAEEFGSQSAAGGNGAEQAFAKEPPIANRIGRPRSDFRRLRTSRRARPRRDGRRVPRPAKESRPRRRAENRAGRFGGHAGRLARFRGEAETAAQLNHPHIVPVYEVGQHDGLPYFTMRYVRGTTLAERLADGPLPGARRRRFWRRWRGPSRKAHQKGVLHRDLKPSNILIDVEGRPYVSDFGLAKRLVPESSDDARTQPLQSTHANRRDPRHARLHEPRAGRRQPRRRSAQPPTSTVSARFCTRCSPAGRRFKPRRPSTRC